jgi:hypothetical protein
VLGLLGLSLAVSAQSRIMVSPDGDDANSGATWATAKRTIGAAIAAASGPTDIWIREGTYNELLTITKDGIGLYGGFAGDEIDLSDRHGGETAIDANYTGRVLELDQVDNTILDHLTIRRGASLGYGGGVEAYSCENTLLHRCTVEDCLSATGHAGGGIAITSGSVSLDNVAVFRCSTSATGGGIDTYGTQITARWLHVEACQAARGGGMAVTAGAGQVADSVFLGNVAGSSDLEGGGGMWLRMVQWVVIRESLFSGNTASYGAALDLCEGTRTQIVNNVVSSNHSGTAAVLIRGDGTRPDFYNNTIADNHSIYGPAALYIADFANPRLRNDLIAYNTTEGGAQAVGWDSTSSGNWAVTGFWMNDNGPFSQDDNCTFGGGSYFDRDPRFLSRHVIEDPFAYQLGPDSETLDYGEQMANADFAGGSRPVNATGLPQAYPDRGAFEYQAVEQYVVLEGWSGPLGDSDQSTVKLHIVLSDLNGDLISDEWVPQSPDGFYVLRGPGLAPESGPYEILFSAPGYLSHQEYVRLPAWNSTGVDVELHCGDVDGDNAVTLQDLNRVLLKLGSPGPVAGDLNGDELVDVLDMNLVLVNFGLSGD